MSDIQVILELDESWRSSLIRAREQAEEVIESFSQRFNFLLFTLNENFEGEHFVCGIIFGNQRHSISSICLGSSCKIAAFDGKLDITI